AVTDPRDGKRVALKKMSNVFQNVVSAIRVYRELRMLCHFRHENGSLFICAVVCVPACGFDRVLIFVRAHASIDGRVDCTDVLIESGHVTVFRVCHCYCSCPLVWACPMTSDDLDQTAVVFYGLRPKYFNQRADHSRGFVVTELMQSDLHKIIVSPQPLTSDHVKVFLYQILRGLKYLHSARVLHRDIKPGNLLVNSNCCLKICDFGLARIMEPDENIAMTQEVVTQYYRAPEILMGAVHYTSAVDIWSVGCIFAELLSRRILFQASAPVQQLDRITEVLGTPSFEDMPTACQGARDYIRSRPHKPAALNQFYSLSEQATHEAVHLLCRMLVLNPNKRITAADALTHPYLDEGRLRFHSCMCTCCTPGTQGRNFCGDLEPECPLPFDYSFEKSLTTVGRVKEKLYKFIQDHQHRSTNKLPLCLNPHAAALAKIQSARVASGAELPPSPHQWT
ncbi:hypothetical protein Btru_064190, partial [Bulinus truncatus]